MSLSFTQVKKIHSTSLLFFNYNKLINDLKQEEFLTNLEFDGTSKEWYVFNGQIWQNLSDFEVKRALWQVLADTRPELEDKLNPEFLKKVMESFAIMHNNDFAKRRLRKHDYAFFKRSAGVRYSVIKRL